MSSKVIKTKKPKALRSKFGILAEIENDRIIFVEGFRDNSLNANYSKRLHKWLGRAIEYLDGKRK